MPVINLAAGEQPVQQIVDVPTLFDKAIQNIYKNHGGKQPLVEKHLFEISNKTLQQGIDKTFKAAGVEFGRENADFIGQFKSNTAVFNAFKNHLQTKEIASQLLDPQGKLRSFSQFKKEALKISEGYNKTWLQTEYNTAVRSARMAANWKQFERTKHLYPNLEYMPSSSANPRDAHKSLWHTIRPIDDPFWNIYMPPSDWNCKCSVRAVKTDPTDVPVDIPVVPPAFRNNPGKSAAIVNMGETPYLINTSSELRTQIIKEADKLMEIESRDKIRKWASETIPEKIGIKIKVKNIPGSVLNMTRQDVHIWTGKKHRYPVEKNKAILDIRNLIENAEYIGWSHDDGRHANVNYWLYYTTKIGDEESYICLMRTIDGEIKPHALKDSRSMKAMQGKIKNGDPEQVSK